MSDLSGISDTQILQIEAPFDGMITDLSSLDKEYQKSFLKMKNYINRRTGIEKRSGFINAVSDSVASKEDFWNFGEIVTIIPYWDITGDKQNLLLSHKYLYRFSAEDGLTEINQSYSTGTVGVSSTAVTGDETEWETNLIQSGDVIVFDPDGDGDGPEEILISAVGGETAITLSEATTGTFTAGTAYSIRKAFNPRKNCFTDWTFARGDGGAKWIIFTDGNSFPKYYDGTSLADLDSTTPPFTNAVCCTFFGDRLWIGNTVEDGVYYQNRIRWSSATDAKSFGALDYLDIPAGAGQLIRLISNGPLLVAYFTNGIFIGRPSNIDDLPYYFTPIDTGGVGLVGMKAISPYLDGHYFVGDDDIYLLMTSLSLKPIGSDVQKETIETCDYKHLIDTAPDQDTNSVLFGFPTTEEGFSNIWAFNTKTIKWSVWSSFDTMTFLENIEVYSPALTWDELETLDHTWDELSTYYPTWLDMSPKFAGRSTFTGTKSNGALLKLNLESEVDQYLSGTTQIDASILGELVTKDYDYNLPDQNKTWTAFKIKLENKPNQDLVFKIETSIDRGMTWVERGDITITSEEDEGKINFRTTGSTLRVRISDYSVSENYIIIELGFRVKQRGPEKRF